MTLGQGEGAAHQAHSSEAGELHCVGLYSWKGGYIELGGAVQEGMDAIRNGVHTRLVSIGFLKNVIVPSNEDRRLVEAGDWGGLYRASQSYKRTSHFGFRPLDPSLLMSSVIEHSVIGQRSEGFGAVEAGPFSMSRTGSKVRVSIPARPEGPDGSSDQTHKGNPRGHQAQSRLQELGNSRPGLRHFPLTSESMIPTCQLTAEPGRLTKKWLCRGTMG